MSTQVEHARKKLHLRVEAAKKLKNTGFIDKNKIECDHEWKRYREQIIADRREGYVGEKTYYFIVAGCSKCKSKRRIVMAGV